MVKIGVFPGEGSGKIIHLSRVKYIEASMGKMVLLRCEALLPILFNADHIEALASAVKADV